MWCMHYFDIFRILLIRKFRISFDVEFGLFLYVVFCCMAIRLRGNALGPFGAEHLAAMLMTNQSLVQIGLFLVKC